MSEISNAVAVQQQRKQDAPVTVASVVNGMSAEVQRATPAGMDGDRLVRIAITLIRSSDIAKATGQASTSLSECDPQSFAASLMTAGAMGLDPGLNGQAYLIPYRNTRARMVECTLIVGYRGHSSLAWRHPMVEDFGSGVVYPGDEFDWEDGMDAHLRHKPGKRDQVGQARPNPDWFYAWGKTRTGARKVVVMSPEEVREMRGGKVGPSGKIIDPQRWMERKVPLKQLLKAMPYSVTDWAHRVDERTGSELTQMHAAETIVAEIPNDQVPDRPVLTDTINGETGEVTAETLDGPAFPDNSPTEPQGKDPWAGR